MDKVDKEEDNSSPESKTDRHTDAVASYAYQDSDEMAKRIQNNLHNIDFVTVMLESHYGARLTVDQLRMFARRLSKRIKVNIDRLANRNRIALLCWYSENWDAIYPHLEEFIPSQNPKTSDNTDNEPQVQSSASIDPSDISQLINTH